MLKLIGSIALAVVLSIGMTGCVSAEQEAAEAADKAAAAAQARANMEEVLGLSVTAEQKNEGYVDVGNGVGVRWATESEKQSRECASYAKSCYYVAIVSNASCSSGIYIELALEDDSGLILGKTNEITPAMGGGDKGVFAIGTTTRAPMAGIAQVSCMGRWKLTPNELEVLMAEVEKGQQLAGHYPDSDALGKARRVLTGGTTHEGALAEIYEKFGDGSV